MINLFNQDSYSLDKIKLLYGEIKVEQLDLYKLLAKSDNYKEGFTNFIYNIKDVELLPEWWDELEEELGHLQSEIAFRREEDVRSAVMSFYINKIKPEPTPITSSGGKTVVQKPVQQVQQDDIKKAKTLVREQTMPNMMWQKVMLDLIEEHPEVSEFLISYLGS